MEEGHHLYLCNYIYTRIYIYIYFYIRICIKVYIHIHDGAHHRAKRLRTQKIEKKLHQSGVV